MTDREIPEHLLRTQEAWNARKNWQKDRQPAPFFEKFYLAHKSELGHEVVDIGAGTGVYSARLAKDGFHVRSFEPSETMRQKAVERLQGEGVADNVTLESDWSIKLPVKDGQADFVISIGAIHHNNWDGVQKSFAEVARILSSGKYFLFQGRSSSESGWPREQIEDHGLTMVDTDDSAEKKGVVQHYFTKEELQELAELNGFEITEDPQEKIRPSGKFVDRTVSRWWVIFKKK